MRLDHIAYRVRDRKAAAKFFMEALGYKVQEEFQLDFADGTFTDCIALEPPERIPDSPWLARVPAYLRVMEGTALIQPVLHVPPELFVSDGKPGSIVSEWVTSRNGVGGVHHMAYQVPDVQNTMDEWRAKGWAEFATDQPITCPGLTQVFTKPSAVTGIIYEFITRDGRGFCKDNVKALMESTKGL